MTFSNPSSHPATVWSGVRCVAQATVALALAAAGWLWIGGAEAQQGDGTGKRLSAIEIEEMKTALEVAQKQLKKAELEAAEHAKANEVLRESLAASNREADEVRAQYEELLLRMASYGVDLVKPDPKSLEQRLLQAVRDCERAEKRSAELQAELAQLSEAVVGYLPTTASSDPAAQARVEASVEAAVKAIRPAGIEAVEPAARRIVEAKVVSIDPEIGLLVVNVGRGSGVRIGMPITVKRGDRNVGVAQVVDVRDTISGALLKSLLDRGDVKVGDRIEPRAEAL